MHVMIDIETLDTVETAIVLSIGAVAFDLDTTKVALPSQPSAPSVPFYTNLKIFPQLLAGRTISPDTLEWWKGKASIAAANAVQGNEVSPDTAIRNLTQYLISNHFAYVWAKSPQFDLNILKNMMRCYGVRVPWDFWMERDVRTIVDIADRVAPATIPQSPSESPHTASEDCRVQIELVCNAYRRLNEHGTA